MVTVPVSNFVSTLRKLVNVPLDNIMSEAIVKTAQAFCRKSQVVVYVRELGAVTALQDYTLISDSELNTVKSLLKCSVVMSVTGIDPLDDVARELLNVEDYIISTRDVISFNDTFTDVKVRCVIEPVQNADELPQVLFDDYLDGICSGAAAYLFMQPDSMWSNPGFAAHHDKIYTETLVNARRFRLEANPNEEAFTNPVRTRSFF